MSAFDECQGIGARGMADIISFLKANAQDGRFVLTDKGNLSEFLQTSVGDALLNCPQGKVWGIELKTEETNPKGNFFLEEWSNFTFGFQKPGWLQTLRTDILLYYFIAEKELYSIPFRPLFEWAYGKISADGSYVHDGKLRHFPAVPQRKHSQRNLTIGRLVKISVIERAVGFRRYLLRGDSWVEPPRPPEQQTFFKTA